MERKGGRKRSPRIGGTASCTPPNLGRPLSPLIIRLPSRDVSHLRWRRALCPVSCRVGVYLSLWTFRTVTHTNNRTALNTKMHRRPSPAPSLILTSSFQPLSPSFRGLSSSLQFSLPRSFSFLASFLLLSVLSIILSFSSSLCPS